MKRLLLLFALFLLCGCSTMTEPIPTVPEASGDKFIQTGKYPDVTVTRLIRVYDGDTFVCDIDELSPLIGKNIRVRLKHIDTPELRDKDKIVQMAALAEKQRLEHLLNSAKVIELRNVDRCKYFRILSEVFIDGENILPKLNQQYVIPSAGGDK